MTWLHDSDERDAHSACRDEAPQKGLARGLLSERIYRQLDHVMLCMAKQFQRGFECRHHAHTMATGVAVHEQQEWRMCSLQRAINPP